MVLLGGGKLERAWMVRRCPAPLSTPCCGLPAAPLSCLGELLGAMRLRALALGELGDMCV